MMITPCAVEGRLAARPSSGVSTASESPSAFCAVTAAAAALSGVALPPPAILLSAASVGRSWSVT